MPTASDSPHFIVRRMRPRELELAIDRAAAEGWNPGLDDASTFYAADPEGFLIATFDDEPIGFISAVAYGDALGFIGLYIVRPEWRGKGCGMQLWRAGMAYLGTRNIALDGVLAQQANYRKSGFVLTHRNVRYEGIVTGEHDDDLVDARSVPFDRLLRFDAYHFAATRESFLRAWLDAPHAHALAAIDGDTLRGYGVIRRCREGHKIGPLFAEDRRVARALFLALAAHANEDGKVVLDVPECNPAAVALAVEYDMTSVFETARMYTQPAPAMPLANIFGVTSFELG
jgi:ribosomal protein S18 acetylase RimI-like enzyme